MISEHANDEVGQTPETRKESRELDRCTQVVRYLLIAANFILCMCSCAVVGVAVWVVVDMDYTTFKDGNPLLIPISGGIIIAGGIIAFVFTYVGCYGAFACNKILLRIYICAMGISQLLLIFGSIVAIAYTASIGERIPIEHDIINMKTLQNDYGVNLDNEYNRFITQTWDKTQKEFQCCAVKDQSWNIYRASEWYTIQTGLEEVDKPYVPESCCVRDQYGDYVDLQKCQTWRQGPPGIRSGEYNEAIFYKGCEEPYNETYRADRELIIKFSRYLIGIGLGVGNAMIPGWVLSLILVVNLMHISG